MKNLYEVIESKEYLPVPPKKKRVFTEVKEIKAKDEPKPERKISIDTKKVTPLLSDFCSPQILFYYLIMYLL